MSRDSQEAELWNPEGSSYMLPETFLQTSSFFLVSLSCSHAGGLMIYLMIYNDIYQLMIYLIIYNDIYQLRITSAKPLILCHHITFLLWGVFL